MYLSLSVEETKYYSFNTLDMNPILTETLKGDVRFSLFYLNLYHLIHERNYDLNSYRKEKGLDYGVCYVVIYRRTVSPIDF